MIFEFESLQSRSLLKPRVRRASTSYNVNIYCRVFVTLDNWLSFHFIFLYIWFYLDFQDRNLDTEKLSAYRAVSRPFLSMCDHTS